MEVLNSVPNPRVKEAVFLAFDDTSIPFSHGLRLQLARGKALNRPNPVVLSRGEEGEPDDDTVRFYGTVIPFGDELRMWYLARGTLDLDQPDRSTRKEFARNGWQLTRNPELRACYATSRDGVTWEKPKLGLVEYNGSKENNIVDLRGGRCDLEALPILYDPEDPDPDRRFKTAFESSGYQEKVAVAYSPDGLRWTESPNNPVAPNLEQTGLIKFNGCYYVNGQGGSHYGMGRRLVTFASYDFENWTEASCLGFQRGNLPPRPIETHVSTAGEQAHLGAGLWDRGNVIIGIYDMWHGPSSGERSQVSIDLGLLISHDALHYREPIPDFRIVPGFEEIGQPLGSGPSVSHGQGMCNLGDQTLLWYEIWPAGDIRLATWPRDQLGYLRPYHGDETGVLVGCNGVRHCITCPIQLEGPTAHVLANVDGLSQHSEVTIELLDEQFRPLPGYSGEACIPLRESGLRQPVRWKERSAVADIRGPFRLRANWGGLRPEDARLFALYVSEGS
ncbi:MAG: hypothetical protein QGI83_12310 [Candidatus Latescibacteria bacterium]|jgi:hypothetical protein|nr:hypothetical protein [Candidatus Latescibacterota bacterium]